MSEDQIAALDDHELLMHIRRLQQIADADRELSELLRERRRRQILAAVGEKSDNHSKRYDALFRLLRAGPCRRSHS